MGPLTALYSLQFGQRRRRRGLLIIRFDRVYQQGGRPGRPGAPLPANFHRQVSSFVMLRPIGPPELTAE